MAFSDSRTIRFGLSDIGRMLADSPQAAGGFGFPTGRPRMVDADDSGGLILVYDTVAPGQVYKSSQAVIAALIIGYCRRARIPVPKDATKHVKISKDSVCIVFEITLAEVPKAVLTESGNGTPNEVQIDRRYGTDRRYGADRRHG